MRAFPTVDCNERRSSSPLCGLVLSIGIATLLNHALTSFETGVSDGTLVTWPSPIWETSSSKTNHASRNLNLTVLPLATVPSSLW